MTGEVLCTPRVFSQVDAALTQPERGRELLLDCY